MSSLPKYITHFFLCFFLWCFFFWCCLTLRSEKSYETQSSLSAYLEKTDADRSCLFRLTPTEFTANESLLFKAFISPLFRMIAKVLAFLYLRYLLEPKVPDRVRFACELCLADLLLYCECSLLKLVWLNKACSGLLSFFIYWIFWIRSASLIVDLFAFIKCAVLYCDGGCEYTLTHPIDPLR